jgi:hypothetical protein
MAPNSINSFNNRSAFLKLLAVFYIILLGGLIGLGVLFYHNNQAFNNSAVLVTHTRTLLGIQTAYYFFHKTSNGKPGIIL